MEELQINQCALAEKMGCSQQYISKILKGKENLCLETISKIEVALKIDLLKSAFTFVDGYDLTSSTKREYLNDSGVGTVDGYSHSMVAGGLEEMS